MESLQMRNSPFYSRDVKAVNELAVKNDEVMLGKEHYETLLDHRNNGGCCSKCKNHSHNIHGIHRCKCKKDKVVNKHSICHQFKENHEQA
jgi:hypothetical protein